VFKSAWRIVQPNEIAVKAYTASATIDLLKSNGIGGIEKSGDTATATVALVGVHVVGVVQDTTRSSSGGPSSRSRTPRTCRRSWRRHPTPR